MPYITLRALPKYHQITFEELLSNTIDLSKLLYAKTPPNTLTYYRVSVSRRLIDSLDFDSIRTSLEMFSTKNSAIYKAHLPDLYETFYIPKSSGGMRRIDAPNATLKTVLTELKTLFEDHLLALHHTSAYAYVKDRSPLDAIRRHQQNESKWFGKFDFKNFFGSTTYEFVSNQLLEIFPFSELLLNDSTRELLLAALKLCFLNNTLPQGTPMSPLLTNIMMVPIDYRINKALRTHSSQVFVYTRYADDILISSRSPFHVSDIQNLICSILSDFKAPFSLNNEKTRYGSSSGSNWNLGLMLNASNEITIGYKRKRQFKLMLNNFMSDFTKNQRWPQPEVRHLQGLISYYLSVEPEYIAHILEQYSKKFSMPIHTAIKQILST